MSDLDLSNLNILIVEDNSHMQILFKEILRAFRIRNVKTAIDGADALRELKTFEADIVLCDWQMNPIDGLEFTKMVRTMSDVSNPYVAIILVTGHTEMNRVFEARDVGVTEFLAKPVSARRLYERICTVIEKPRKFVRSKTYRGPDRRRRARKEGDPMRRATDKGGKEDE